MLGQASPENSGIFSASILYSIPISQTTLSGVSTMNTDSVSSSKCKATLPPIPSNVMALFLYSLSCVAVLVSITQNSAFTST